jgi:hypothetical protein
MTTQIQNASNHKANMGQGSRLIAGAALIAIGCSSWRGSSYR